MGWRLAKSLEGLRAQVNAAAPKRSKASDGTIGDTAHSARKSDHNPDSSGIVRALDLTHDPRNGMDGDVLARSLVASRDSRIKYIIWNRRIISGAKGPQPWVWRAYTGANPHDKHVHVSVLAGAAGDRAGPWEIALEPPNPNIPEKKSYPLLKRGMKSTDVQTLQELLVEWGAKIEPDRVFGPKTESAVRAFQKAKGLVVDGIVGDYTWRALLAGKETR